MNRREANLLAELIKSPQEVVEKLDLVYSKDEDFKIFRREESGQFRYLFNGEVLLERKEIERIQHLAIPPAWQEVKIVALQNGHLQATGRDSKSRKQYRYHPLWSRIRNQTKFYKMVQFGEQLPKIRLKVDQHLSLSGWPKEKVLALIIRLMEETHIRIGNEQYAKRNKTYGLTTLRTRHVHLEKDKMKFEFVGKKGKRHSVSLRDKRLIYLVNRCEEIPGWELFQYFDNRGRKQGVESSMVNRYIQDICGEIFTAKDFRTWAASIIFFETLMDLGISENEKEIAWNLRKGYDSAAKQLGNTRNVCRKYYVHPGVAQQYETGEIKVGFDRVIKLSENIRDYFTPTEEVLLELLQAYKPEFLK